MELHYKTSKTLESKRTSYFFPAPYYRALGGKSYASMIRTREHKLVVYHGTGLGELFDMQKDPHEFTNLWEDPAYSDARFKLMSTAFDAAAFATDLGPRRVAGH